MSDALIGNRLLYVRYYERIDETREMITKKYYDLLDERTAPDNPSDHSETIGTIWPVSTLLEDLESAAIHK